MCYKIVLKERIVKVLLYIFGKAFQFLSNNDSAINNEILTFKEGFVVNFSILPKGSIIGFRKTKNSFLFLTKPQKNPDLVIGFKNLCSSLQVFAGQIAPYQAFSQHRMFVKGDIADALILTRAINRVTLFLFPYFILKKINKSSLRITLKDRLLSLYIYCFVILFTKGG